MLMFRQALVEMADEVVALAKLIQNQQEPLMADETMDPHVKVRNIQDLGSLMQEMQVIKGKMVVAAMKGDKQLEYERARTKYVDAVIKGWSLSLGLEVEFMRQGNVLMAGYRFKW